MLKKSALAAGVVGAGLFMYIGSSIGEASAENKNSACEAPVKNNSTGTVAVASCIGIDKQSENSALSDSMEENVIVVELIFGALGAGVGIAVANQILQMRTEIKDSHLTKPHNHLV